MDRLKRHWWKVLLAVALVSVGVAWCAFSPPAKHPKDWTIEEISTAANLAMALAASVGVYGLVAWRNAMVGQTMHTLALDVMTWAWRVDQTFRDVIDEWKLADASEKFFYGPLSALCADVNSILEDLPLLEARTKGLHKNGPVEALDMLGARMSALQMALANAVSEANHVAPGQRYSLDVQELRVKAGVHEPDVAKGRILSLVKVAEQWAEPHLRSGGHPPIDTKALNKIEKARVNDGYRDELVRIGREKAKLQKEKEEKERREKEAREKQQADQEAKHASERAKVNEQAAEDQRELEESLAAMALAGEAAAKPVAVHEHEEAPATTPVKPET